MKNLDKIMQQLDNIGELEPTLIKVLGQGAKVIQADAKRLAPVDSGALRMTIYTNTEKQGDDIVSKVIVPSPYGAFVEFGTGPVGEASPKILPPDVKPVYTKKTIVKRKTKKGLKYYQMDGWTYYSKKLQRFVYTKGQPAKPFLYPAFKNNKEKVKELIAKGLKKYIEDALK